MLSAKIKDQEVGIGDMVKVSTTIVEGVKTRVQTFEGIVISMKGRGENQTMTVRRIGARQIGVERIWPINSPSIVGVVVTKHKGRVRRAKLFYLRDRKGRRAVQV